MSTPLPPVIAMEFDHKGDFHTPCLVMHGLDLDLQPPSVWRERLKRETPSVDWRTEGTYSHWLALADTMPEMLNDTCLKALEDKVAGLEEEFGPLNFRMGVVSAAQAQFEVNNPQSRVRAFIITADLPGLDGESVTCIVGHLHSPDRFVAMDIRIADALKKRSIGRFCTSC